MSENYYAKAVGIATLCAVLAGASSLLAAPPASKSAKTKVPVHGAATTTAKPTTQTNFSDNTPLTQEQKIVHVLNRFGFGPRPGDIEKVRVMGLDKYIDQQLHPERIADRAVDTKLASFQYLMASSENLAEMYYDRTVAYQEAQKMRKEIIKDAQASTPTSGAAATPPEDAAKKQQLFRQNATPQERQEAIQARMALVAKATPIAQASKEFTQAKVLRAVESERQLQEVMADFWTNHFNIDTRKGPCETLKIADDRDVIRAHSLGKFRDLLGASAKSPAMLFYLDNFQSVTPQPPPQRRGRLAQAMAAKVPPANAKRPTPGINENYAREIMELHTLGVDGGYTQKDVQEVARCLTGWGISGLRGAKMGKGGYKPSGTFEFHPFLHDNGEKVVLGRMIPAGGGMQDGETVLDLLASHPATMKFVSRKLCQRFVSDNPPASLVDKCVATWKRTDGDIREVVRTIATSPEFYSRASYRQKIKSPFEYAVSSVRALGGSFQIAGATPGGKMAQGDISGKLKVGAYRNADPRTLQGQVATMGEPLFQYQAPTGYSEDSQKWVSSGALISRLNFSISLLTGKVTDLNLPTSEQYTQGISDPALLVNKLADQILHGDISPSTRATLLKQSTGENMGGASLVAETVSAPTAAKIAALVLGSPEFQRR